MTAASLRPVSARFADPELERAFQDAGLGETRTCLILLGLVGLLATLAGYYMAARHLPHEPLAYQAGQAVRLLLAVVCLASIVFVLARRWTAATLLRLATLVLALGCFAITLRMTMPPPPDASFLVGLSIPTRDGVTILLVVAVAALTLIPGHFLANSIVFALALVAFLAMANRWPDGPEDPANFTYAYSVGFLFVLALGHGIQRMRRRVFIAGVELRRANEQLHEFAIRDYLTDCFNRRHFYTLVNSEIERARRYGTPLALVMLDLDHFKAINDRHGHAAGDAVLCQVVDVVQQRLRTSDVLARLGGEEFVLLLPETGLNEARQLAERLRNALDDAVLSYAGKTMHLTASWGVARFRESDPDVDTVLDRADRALYAAKDGGRDQVRDETEVGDAAR